MRKIIFKFGLKCLILIASFLTIFAIPVLADSNEGQRIYGADRYRTSLAIAEQVNKGQVGCVVLAPGNSYSNALPASVLAYKNNAPLLLVNSTAANTFEAFDYIKAHLPLTGKIYLVGDKSYIKDDFAVKLKNMGYSNIITISGADIYETDYLIAEELNVENDTPFVISSGTNFPDALSISSVASVNGWPILLTDGNNLTDDIKSLISEKLPSTVYITGGPGAIAASVENQIKSIVPNATIKRLGGSDRYETATLIANNFFPSSSNIYIASGLNYPDALAGSVLAAKNNSPIVLINPNTKRSVPNFVVRYLVDFRHANASKNLIAFGGTAAVPEDIFTMANDLVGNMKLTSLGQPVEFDYKIVKDPLLQQSEFHISGNGILTEEEEKALVIAVRYYVQANSINIELLKDKNSTFGREYCLPDMSKSMLKYFNSKRDSLIETNFMHKVKKITLSNYGKNIYDKKNPYNYFTFSIKTEIRNEEIPDKKCTIYMDNDNNYWEITMDSNRAF